MTNAELVLQFMHAYDQSVSRLPTGVVPADVRELRVSLIDEEFGEYVDGVIDADVVAIADALADLLYVVYGAAHTYGIPIDAVFREVHRSNMTKLGDDGKPVYRGDGKVIKGPNYEPPDIASVLALGYVGG